MRAGCLVAAGLGGLAILGTAGLLALALVRPGPPVRSTQPTAPAAAAPVAKAAPAARGQGEGTIVASATATAPEAEDAARKLAEALLPLLGREGQVREALRAARAGEIDPVELGLKLHDAIGGRPEVAAPLIPELVAERNAEIAFKLAQALGEVQDDAELRRATVDALAAADPAARAVGLLALLGRGEEEAVGLAARSFADDPPEARATAGFLLNQAPGGLRPSVRDRVLEAARAALRDPRTAERVREEALGLLGRPDAPEGDILLIERALFDGPEAGVRGRALRALVEGGIAPARVRSTLERALALAGMPDDVKQAIRAYLAAPGR